LEIKLSRGEGWDPVIKRRGLRSSYQEGRVEDPVIKRRVLRSSYQEGRVGIPLTCLTPPYFVPVPRHVGHGFPTSNGHMSWTQYSVSSVKMRGDSSFCWYWWNWWPSLFKLNIKYYTINDIGWG
jgi:hypothetical protein